jgi:hypothetical protein
LEYRAGLDPKDAKSRLYYTYTGGPNPSLSVGPIDQNAKPIVQTSDALTVWTPLDPQLYTLESEQLVVDLGGLLPSGFFRVVIFEE